MANPVSENWKIKYEVGNPHFGGKTIVELNSDKEIHVQVILGDVVSQYQSRLKEKEAASIFNTFIENFYEKNESGNTALEPDEEIINIYFTKGDILYQHISPSNTQWHDQRLRNLVLLFSKLAFEVSGGKVKF